MSLSFGINPWLLLPAALAAGALTIWLYRTTTPELSRAKRLLLGALRFTVLFLILLLLFEPVLRLVDQEEKRPILAVLLDNSRSLLLTAGADSTADNVHGRVAEILEQLPAAVRNADLQVYTFDSELSSPIETGFHPDSLRFEGNRTNIAHALDQVREQLRNENFGAALLISDGQYNTGRNPLYTADRFPVPIYTAVLGDTSRHRDVQIRRVTTNDIAYVGAALPVQVGVRTEATGGEQVTVSITRDGVVVASERTTLPDGSTEVTVDLSLTPGEEGLHRFDVAVSRVPGEVTYRNNRESFTVRVLRTKRRVLLVGAAPGPDVSAARQLLEIDQTFEVTSFVQKSIGAFYEGAFPSRLSEFDLIVLAGYPGRLASVQIVEQIADAGSAGTPIFFMLTRDTDPGAIGESLSGVLPVGAERVRSGFVDAAFAPTPGGMNHPILEISGASSDAWLRLPPLLYSQTRWRVSPDAETLARIQVRGVDLDDPMLVIRRRSRNRTAALLGANTWRWRNVPEDLSEVAHLWPTLFTNTIQWLTAREDDRPVRVVPVRDLFGGGENVQFSGQVYDESLNPVSDASVEVRVTAPDGTVSPYVMSPIGNGRYTLDAGTFPEGTYRYAAAATDDDEVMGTDEGSFAVGALTLEYKETRANAPLMRQIAQRSGGEFLDNEDVTEFSSRLASSGAFASLVVEHESEVELRRRYIFLALIILLLTTEWFVRKRSGMV